MEMDSSPFLFRRPLWRKSGGIYWLFDTIYIKVNFMKRIHLTEPQLRRLIKQSLNEARAKNERRKPNPLVKRVTESVYRQLRKLNEAQEVGDNGGWPSYDMGCNYEDANFDEISQIIGDCTGECFKDYFFSNEQWDSNDLQSKIFFKFNDIESNLVVTVGGGYYINYDDDDTPIGLEIWMGMGNYSVGEERADGNYSYWSDLSKDMKQKVDWQKVSKVISSYSIDEPTPEFLEAFDMGAEKQVLGYDKETSQRTRPSAPQFVRNESFSRNLAKSIMRTLNESIQTDFNSLQDLWNFIQENLDDRKYISIEVNHNIRFTVDNGIRVKYENEYGESGWKDISEEPDDVFEEELEARKGEDGKYHINNMEWHHGI